MTDTVLIVEEIDDVNKIQNIISRSDPKIFSLNYVTHVSLEKHKISHSVGELYLSDADYDIIDRFIIDTTLNWYKNELLEKAIIFDGINLASSLEMEFIQYFSKIYLSILTIKRIIETEKPKHVFCLTHINDFIKRYCQEKRIQVTDIEKKINQSLILDKINIKVDLLSIPISIHISRQTFLKIKKIEETLINRIFRFNPHLNPQKDSILLLDFNPTMYGDLIKELSLSKSQIVLLNQRRPAVWNWKSLQQIRATKCKIIHLHNFEQKIQKTLEKELKTFDKKMNEVWSSDKILEHVFSVDGISFWHSIKHSFMEICTSRFKESIRRILLSNELFKTLRVSVILEWAETAQEEKDILQVAKKFGIKSVLLQHAMYPTTKILEPFGRFLSYFSYPTISDKQAIWGNIMKQYAIEHGYKQDALLVTGSPRHDHFFNSKVDPANEATVILATSGATGITAKYSTTLARLNYDKFTRETIRAIKKITNKKIIVKIAPHQEHVGIANVIDMIKEIDPNITIIINANITELISSCDALITFNNSTIALESLILGKPTASIQTEEWLSQEEIVKSGAILSINDITKIEDGLSKLITDQKFRQKLQDDAKTFVQQYLANGGNASKTLREKLENL